MRRVALTLAAATLLIAAAPFKLAPADDKPAQAVGAAARARNGPDPMTKPPADIGSAEDPEPIAAPVPLAPPAGVAPKG